VSQPVERRAEEQRDAEWEKVMLSEAQLRNAIKACVFDAVKKYTSDSSQIK